MADLTINEDELDKILDRRATNNQYEEQKRQEIHDELEQEKYINIEDLVKM